jgi:hypothetical protein
MRETIKTNKHSNDFLIEMSQNSFETNTKYTLLIDEIGLKGVLVSCVNGNKETKR